MIARRLAASLLVALVAAPVAAEEPPRPAPLECLGAAAIQEALGSGRARRLAEVGRRLDGDILRAELCRRDGGLVYRVTLFDPDGRVRRIQIDAVSGRLLYDGR